MNINNLADLGKIIDLCRKKGVESLKIDNIELKLSREIPQSKYKRKSVELTSEMIPVDDISDEQALYWSSPNPQEEALSG